MAAEESHGHMAGRKILGQQIIKNGVRRFDRKTLSGWPSVLRIRRNKPMFFCHIIPFFRTYRPAGRHNDTVSIFTCHCGSGHN